MLGGVLVRPKAASSFSSSWPQHQPRHCHPFLPGPALLVMDQVRAHRKGQQIDREKKNNPRKQDAIPRAVRRSARNLIAKFCEAVVSSTGSSRTGWHVALGRAGPPLPWRALGVLPRHPRPSRLAGRGVEGYGRAGQGKGQGRARRGGAGQGGAGRGGARRTTSLSYCNQGGTHKNRPETH